MNTDPTLSQILAQVDAEIEQVEAHRAELLARREWFAKFLNGHKQASEKPPQQHPPAPRRARPMSLTPICATIRSMISGGTMHLECSDVARVLIASGQPRTHHSIYAAVYRLNKEHQERHGRPLLVRSKGRWGWDVQPGPVSQLTLSPVK